LTLTENTKAIPEVLDIGLLGFIYQHIARVCFGRVVADL